MSDYDLINGEILTVSVTVDEEIITAEINTAARGPAGPAGSGGTATWGGITGTLSAQTDLQTALNLKAPLASPALTGTPTAPTAVTTTSTTQLATTAFVQQELASGTATAKNVEVFVRNVTGATITKGSIVYINGASGNRPTITKAQANNDANSAQTIGFVKADISNNGTGYVITSGDLENVNTNGIGVGVQLYLSPTTAGTWTTTKPSAPNHLVYVGIVVVDHPTQGIIYVAIQNGYELNELHDVAISSPAAKQVIKRNAGNTLWVNEAIVIDDISNAGVTGAELFGAATEKAAREAIGTAIRTRAVIVQTDFYNTSDLAGMTFAGFNSGIATQAATNSTKNHPGILRIASGAATNSGSRLRHDGSAMVLGGGESCEWVFQIQSLSNGVTTYIGFHDTSAQTTPSNGVWVQFDANGTTLTCSGKTNAGSTPTTTATAYSAAINTWYSLTVDMNANATLATFTLRSEAGAVLWTDTLSSNIPNGASQRTSLGFNAFNVNNSSVPLALIDYASMEINRTLTR